MTLTTLLLLAAGLIGIGVYGALSQQSFVMLMMGLELILNGVMLAAVAFWALTGAGMPQGQLLTIVVMAVMAIEMAMGFALVVAVYRAKQADTTEALDGLKH
ncbi:NADH-quinone oxidoreductase subunit NuoK [Stutzerimonas balearica]|jgi:NAD(P)H-quinone oxidoreductase subunit 4L|uniref:NADH-quinone oxidoreductase subunit K n=1 Tax=Stutzerimonas balearica TaxID=74829 RepID=A0A9X7YR81_9GAMM|nr:NADH-quinone oxidoreductase subunit NuoK [Stutzerimonas balearica]KIL06013.1 NADH-ubiquinone oxidoreductase [Stutzerimonas stutzeri]MBB63253.1 NADH-quinone oxidoreductase subunit NuoK [Pseudomonas sp.]WIX01143.1 NADH-quinone oxidoreductase subunit NuoK [Pseudomonas sp. AR5]MBC7198551.1 NADH-quinone oxidoreductase subunit NuoK [Stutzerimonas balearica]MBD3736643.1 NADH-quinone oxidoreductase subunit NuoK [Stutzerimonas balearica]